MSAAYANSYPIIVGLGESLFDCFPDRRVIGGAPLNFAFHADQLVRAIGGIGIVASRVGQDSLGQQLRQTLSQSGLDLTAIQLDPDRPTGEVAVNIDQAHHPTYVIRDDVAWDHFVYNDDWADLAGCCDAVSFGTLAQRCAASRETIHRFLQRAKAAIRLCDVNLRQQFYDARILHRSFAAATVVKMNESELATVGKLLEIGGGASCSEDDRARAICRKYQLDKVVVTYGAQGSVMFDADCRYEGQVAKADARPGADSVGAGDSCAAAITVGLLARWSPSATLSFANAVGACVASHAGATPRLDAGLMEYVADHWPGGQDRGRDSLHGRNPGR